MSEKPDTPFDEFWRLYVRKHSRPATRWLHAAGTLLAVSLLVAAAVLQRWWLVVGVLPLGYGLAWLSHYAIERNRPLTLSHPWWSLRADFKMLALTLTGRMAREVERCSS
jgi:hypothetical protein